MRNSEYRMSLKFPLLDANVRFGSMLSINVFRGASEKHCFKIGVWRAISIQRTRHMDSIDARALLVADFMTASTQSGHSRARRYS